MLAHVVGNFTCGVLQLQLPLQVLTTANYSTSLDCAVLDAQHLSSPQLFLLAVCWADRTDIGYLNQRLPSPAASQGQQQLLIPLVG